ncbi:hypothetical protein [Pontixanthobacter sp. CEM42]|uniref:ArnT family glycosyltransferase n=1 Tax=Pontixanthobacter sp. CEM42 TaxID=2792077 RepID=UPI001ADEE1A6|nr:hypothetical protein [Pontixanthobacter sp. CEM42]
MPLSTNQMLRYALAAAIVLQAVMISLVAVNWDEFFFYHQVWQFAQEGVLTSAIQTLHVRLFGWITWLPGVSVDHIIIARYVMFAFELVTLGSIYALARRFSTQDAALLCALAYVSFGFVFMHGFSFRTDPMAAAFLSGALALFAWKRLTTLWIIAIGCLTALAFLTTIKSILWAPAFAGLAWLRWADEGYDTRAAIRLVAVAAAVTVAGAFFYWLHSLALEADHVTKTGNAGRSAARKMFSLGIQPYWNVIPKAITTGFVGALLIAFAPSTWKATAAAKRIALIGLWLPVTTFLFYHNTAPYFYAFILPPVFVACAPVAKLALEKYRPALIVAAVTIVLPIQFLPVDHRAKANQIALIETADRMFDQPVRYFDANFMLAGFDKKNGFMTPWGIESYLWAEKRVYRDGMAKETIPLVVENDSAWTRLLTTDEPAGEFLAEDAAAIRDTFIHAWGPFWLAGIELPVGQTRNWTVRVPGEYHVRQGTIQIDGQTYREGQMVTLDRGVTSITSAGSTNAELMWADGVTMPEAPMPPGPIWTYF